MLSASTPTTGPSTSGTLSPGAFSGSGLSASFTAQAAAASTAATARNAVLGRPGINASSARTPAATANGRGRAKSCIATSSPRCSLEAARVVIRAPAIDTSSDGMAVTRPSPTVRIVYVSAAVAMSMPCCITPMMRPATMLTAVMSSAAIESRCVNRMAPSIEP